MPRLLNDAMTLTPIHPDGMRLLRHYEKLCLNAYQCPADVWTIGYGHTAGVKRGDTITPEQAEAMLRADLQIFVNGVRTAIKGTPLNAYRFAAMLMIASIPAADQSLDAHSARSAHTTPHLVESMQSPSTSPLQ